MNTDLIEKLESLVSGACLCGGLIIDHEDAALLRSTITTLQQAHGSQEARRVQETSEVPCCLCGGPVVEFTVPSVHWNRIIRKNQPETDKEYLCWECFEKELIAQSALDEASPELVQWLKAQLAKAEHAVSCREQGEKCWSGGTDELWRKVAQAAGGPYHSRAKRLELAAKEKRIGDKCRKDVEMWKETIAIVIAATPAREEGEG